MNIRLSSIVLALGIAVVFVAGSCTRSYICHCNIAYSGTPGLPDTTFKEYNITDTKSNAQSQCKAESGTYDNNYIHTVDSCYLY